MGTNTDLASDLTRLRLELESIVAKLTKIEIELKQQERDKADPTPLIA